MPTKGFMICPAIYWHATLPRCDVIDHRIDFLIVEPLLERRHKRSAEFHPDLDVPAVRLHVNERHFRLLEKPVKTRPELLGSGRVDIVAGDAIVAIERLADLQMIFLPRRRGMLRERANHGNRSQERERRAASPRPHASPRRATATAPVSRTVFM